LYTQISRRITPKNTRRDLNDNGNSMRLPAAHRFEC
jgi:hypothetical protein